MNANCRRCFKHLFANKSRCQSCGAKQDSTPQSKKSPEQIAAHKAEQEKRAAQRVDRRRVQMLHKELWDIK